MGHIDENHVLTLRKFTLYDVSNQIIVTQYTILESIKEFRLRGLFKALRKQGGNGQF